MPFRFRRRAKRNDDQAVTDKSALAAVDPHDKATGRSRFELFKFLRKSQKPKSDDGSIDHTVVLPKVNEEKEEPTTNRAKAGNASRPVSPEPVDAIVSEDDISRLFSGAPHYSVDNIYGQISPRVSFPEDFSLKVRDVSDSELLGHVAFSGATLRKHLPGPGISGSAANKGMIYDIGVQEMPNMLSATGNELGTVGFDHFLQEPFADTDVHANSERSGEIFDDFSNFELLESQPEKLGIRKFDKSVVVERLVELSGVYSKASESGTPPNVLAESSSGVLYSTLFGKILTPPKYDGSTEDPTGLKVQIETLIRVLNRKRIWYDFSNVEWRIRIGQLLFMDSSPGISDGNVSEPEDGLSERDVVLLQLLLACELYARLDAIANLSLEELIQDLHLTKDEVDDFRGMESRKTRWDLVLACRFLENVEVKSYTRAKMIPNNANSLARRFFLTSSTADTIQVDEMDIAFLPRKQDQQLDGLFHFAKSISWPNEAGFKRNLSGALGSEGNDFGAHSPSIYATPLSTPGSITPRSLRAGQGGSYFTRGSPEMSPRSFQLQAPSPLSLSDTSDDATEAPVHIGGWLTRSFLVGLVMPGEAISHLLISSILENDAESIAILGENANLYGGFVYQGRSFWSKSCIVGRVLACVDGSAECMGWISTTVVPKDIETGWIDVQCSPMFAGLRDQTALEEHLASGTDFFAQKSDVKFTDLSLPQDEDFGSKPAVLLDAFLLDPAETPMDASTSISDMKTSSAILAFTLSTNPEDLHAFSLRHLVQFVSAYPCTPPNLSALKPIKGGSAVKMAPAHPLHSSQRYEIVQVTELVNLDFKLSSREGLVNVVDARGDDAAELLARAWCSSAGENSLIARVGVTCLACAVREAKVLGIRVVVRIGIA